ncbi:MAG: ATP-binding cassette domain-containing protein, partial [Desulfobacteraceae bacterium]|nr:ATP-binding cassette domain-containing protein [Desulfobacteraceae bacterium]
MFENPIVELNHVDFSYNGEPVLQHIHLDIHPHDFIAVIGPNGGGKSTLLKLILGLLTPDKGEIKVMGKAPRKASSIIGYVPQN